MAWTEARFDLAGIGDCRKISDERPADSLANSNWGGIFGAFGFAGACLCHGPAACRRCEQSGRSFCARDYQRKGTHSVSEREGWQDCLEARIRLSVYGELSGWTARRAIGQWWKSLYARGRRESALPR